MSTAMLAGATAQTARGEKNLGNLIFGNFMAAGECSSSFQRRKLHSRRSISFFFFHKFEGSGSFHAAAIKQKRCPDLVSMCFLRSATVLVVVRGIAENLKR